MAELAELIPWLEAYLPAGACLSAFIGLLVRALRPRNRFEALAGAPDRSIPWLGIALGLLILLILLPWFYL